MPKHSDAPLDLHEWISFEDRHDRRTWVFDATFLRSNWSCIYGAGCKGVLDVDATDLAQGCCSHGAHFVDDDDVQTVLNALTRLEPRHWQNYKKGHKKGVLETEDGATKTRVVNDACIFHNEPDFPGGAGCALHIAAVEAGERYIDWKPDVCWQLPLRLEHHTDDNGYLTSTCASGSGATGATAVPTSTGGAPRPATPSSAACPRTSTSTTRSSRWSAKRPTTRWWNCSSAPSGPRSPTPPSRSDETAPRRNSARRRLRPTSTSSSQSGASDWALRPIDTSHDAPTGTAPQTNRVAAQRYVAFRGCTVAPANASRIESSITADSPATSL